jgi:diacylglycerol kinase (ATP)
MKIAFVVKATIKHKRKFYEDIAVLESKNLFESVDVFESEYAGHSIELASNATKNGYDYIIAIGGDGTLNEVLNGCIKSEVSEHPIMGHVPFGTANDFSKTAGLNGGMEQLISLIENEQSELIDIGRVEYTTVDAGDDTSYFLNITDAGIGGLVVEKVNKSKKRLGPNFTFVKAITEAFITYEKSKVKCVADTFEWEGKILTVAAANGKYFGSGMCIAPKARLNSGKLSIVIIGDISMKDYLLNFPKIKKGQVIDHPKVHYFEAKKIEVTPEEYSSAIDMDGEFLGYAPMKIEVMPRELEFLIPNEFFGSPAADEE